jgi:hypothetical protein
LNKQRKEAFIPENIEAPNSPEHVAAASDAVEDEPMEVAPPEPRAPPPEPFTLGDLVRIHPESAPGVRSYFANAFIGIVCRMEYSFQKNVYIVDVKAVIGRQTLLSRIGLRLFPGRSQRYRSSREAWGTIFSAP